LRAEFLGVKNRSITADICRPWFHRGDDEVGRNERDERREWKARKWGGSGQRNSSYRRKPEIILRRRGREGLRVTLSQEKDSKKKKGGVCVV